MAKALKPIKQEERKPEEQKPEEQKPEEQTPEEQTPEEPQTPPYLVGVFVVGADGEERPATEADVLAMSDTHMVMIDGQRLEISA